MYTLAVCLVCVGTVLVTGLVLFTIAVLGLVGITIVRKLACGAARQLTRVVRLLHPARLSVLKKHHTDGLASS